MEYYKKISTQLTSYNMNFLKSIDHLNTTPNAIFIGDSVSESVE